MFIAILLSAGESRRMIGGDKQRLLKPILPFGRSTVIETILQTLLYCKMDKIVVILGHRAADIKKIIKEYPVDIALNRYYRKGMLSSIKTGIRRVGKYKRKGKNIILCLVDQPNLNPKIIKKLKIEFYKTPESILIPVYKNKKGHPIVIPQKYFNEILSIPVEKGLREFMQHHPEDIRYIPVNSSSILYDMDTPEEYNRELMKYGKRK